MKVCQVKGNTWVIEAEELIPFYRLDAKRCILLDSGLVEERDGILKALSSEGLTPAGILCSHAHVDHCANNQFFQQEYGIPVALTAPEAGMCSSIMTLKCYFLTLSPGTVERESGCMVHTPDRIIPSQDGFMEFEGVQFQIIHTPGHSSGHVAVVTPDNVCYVGDAVLSWELMNAKLPYELHHKAAAESREKLKRSNCECYVMAHRGICSREEMGRLIDANQDLLRRRTQEVLDLIDDRLTFSQINERVCRYYKLFTKVPRRALRFERNIRFFVEYLLDEGKLEMQCVNGTVHYVRT